MCAKADYREGFWVMGVELRRLARQTLARWRRRFEAAIRLARESEKRRLGHAS